jgi:hypothetical protein
MRKKHNKLFYGKYTHKAEFRMPWCGWLYPTTDEHLQRLLSDPTAFDGHMQFATDIFKVKKHKLEIMRLADFILKNRNHIKFRLQSPNAIFYGSRSVIHQAITTFWDNWRDCMETDATHIRKMEPNTVICNRLPHNQYQYQIYLKRDAQFKINDRNRKSLAKYLLQNTDVARVVNSHMLNWLNGESEHCEGYFYIADEKCLTPVYMIINESIDKIVKYVKISNDRNNKKINR